MPKKRKKLQRRSSQRFVSSGCLPLDLAIGGGWGYGRIANLVGDSATGKSLLAIEACANFIAQYDGDVFYIEAEAAFDRSYAEGIGLDVERVELVEDVETIEEFVRRVNDICKGRGEDRPALVILDSLDALSDEQEVGRDVGEGSYKLGKAKMMSELFRRLAQKIKASHVTLIIVSQTRDNIGVTFGAAKKRSGGNALQFYSSQVVWLSHLGKIEKTRKGVKRPIGAKVKAKVTKSRFGPPHRVVFMPLYFAYGIDDLEACIAYLIEVKETQELFDSEDGAKKFVRDIAKLDQNAYAAMLDAAHFATRTAWHEVETTFLPTRKKYGEAQA